MGTKANPSPNDIYERLEDHEPYIAFAGRDPLGGGMGRYYASLLAMNWELSDALHATLKQVASVRKARPGKDNAHIAEARQVADEMDEWFQNLQRAARLAPATDDGE